MLGVGRRGPAARNRRTALPGILPEVANLAPGGFAGPTPRGVRGEIRPTGPLPIEGAVELDLPVERMWEAFCDVSRWSSWNPCIWWARVIGGQLREGARLVWCFNPIRPRYLYKLPAAAEIVELEAGDRVTWEARAPGFHAIHSYRFAAIDGNRSRFGSWEVAEGRAYRATQRFWLAHFRYVCRSSLAGATKLASERAAA
jgi:polyketide cyclase/dehydrase/lipid transport protein